MIAKVSFLLLLANAIFARISADEAKSLYTLGYYYSLYLPLEESLADNRVLRFSVRAARDAHILLAPTHNPDDPVYEIVLGARNNTVNQIRGRCPCQEEPNASVRTVNLLSELEFQNFWIQLRPERLKSVVQVGLGDSEAPFHEWADPRPLRPQYLSFRSTSRAEWLYGYRDSSYKRGVPKDERQVVVTANGFGQFFDLSDVVSHSDDGITLYFTVRSSRELQILFSPSVSTLGDLYLIGIHSSGAYIKTRLLGEDKATLQQEGFLKGNKRTRFWIKLSTDAEIALGQADLLQPLLRWRDPYPVSPQYLSFALRSPSDEEEEVTDPTTYADVQYGLGPDYELLTQDCFPRWKDATTLLPAGAVHGGTHHGAENYVCRAQYQGDVIPGNFILEGNKRSGCFVSRNYTIIEASEFEVLTGCRMSWSPASLGDVPNGAIVGGFEKGKARYFIVRLKYKDHLVIGNLQQAERTAYFPYNGQAIPFPSYETLVQTEIFHQPTNTAGTGLSFSSAPKDAKSAEDAKRPSSRRL